MKPESTKHRLTDKDRDAVLKLIVCGLSTEEIKDILHFSASTISYIRQAHNACMKQDWSTLQKLSLDTRATVDWAMKVTGTDKVFQETFGEPSGCDEPAVPAPEYATKEDFLAMYATMQDVRNLLIEIRDALK